MILSVILKVEVEDVIEAEQKTSFVRERLQDHPEIQVTANVSESIQPPQ